MLHEKASASGVMGYVIAVSRVFCKVWNNDEQKHISQLTKHNVVTGTTVPTASSSRPRIF
jgi:hypothetical protein